MIPGHRVCLMLFSLFYVTLWLLPIFGSLVVLFYRKEIPDAIKEGVTSRSRRRRSLETVASCCQCVEFALDAHSSHFFPRPDGAHWRVFVGVTMQEQRGNGVQIE